MIKTYTRNHPDSSDKSNGLDKRTRGSNKTPIRIGRMNRLKHILSKSTAATGIIMCLFFASCHNETQAERIARLEREKEAEKTVRMVLISIIVGATVVGVVWVIGTGRYQEYQSTRRDYRETARRCNRGSQEIETFVSQCCFIMQQEAKQTRGDYSFRSAATRARRKMLRLVNQALGDIKVIFRHDPTRNGYIVMEELGRIQSACLTCRSKNKNRVNPSCGVLEQRNQEIRVELEFETKGS